MLEADELARALIELASEADELAQRAECGPACDASARVCELAARLCAIAERNPGDEELGERCADGQRRCDRARARVAEVCACPAVGPHRY